MARRPVNFAPPAGWTAPFERPANGAAYDPRLSLFWLLLMAGAILRLWHLGDVPAGLNSDEASTGVEALSLLETGADRWGNRWPVWFPAWGSGMNALYTYLAIPVIAAFGLKVAVLRVIGALFGVMTLPVAYHAAKHYFGRDTALVTMGLLALLPWHVMSSRWALDSNLAPFFFVLGLLTIGRALDRGGSRPLVAFLPWAIALYAYPVTLPPEALAAVAILVLFWPTIRPDWPRWAAGIALAGLIALPFLLFLAKNQAHVSLPFERYLPFSVPELAATRLSQIGQSLPSRIFDNLSMVWSGFRDGAVWHQSAAFPPLTAAMPYAMVVGTLVLGWRCRQTRRPHVILIVLLSLAGPLVMIPFNVTRLNWFYIPALMAVADLFVRLYGSDASRAVPYGRLFALASAAYLGVFLALFYPSYFLRYNDEILSLDKARGNGFRVGLENALWSAHALGPDQPMLVDIGTVHPYLYPLFFGLDTIETFQKTRQLRVENGVNIVSSFGRFYFEREALPPGAGFTFVVLAAPAPCAAPELDRKGPLWLVGRCPAATSSTRQ